MSKQSTQTNKNYLNERDAFKSYPNPYNIKFRDYKLILKTFFWFLMRSVIATGINYVFPYKLGIFGVRKKPTWGRGVFDYKLYKETGIKR